MLVPRPHPLSLQSTQAVAEAVSIDLQKLNFWFNGLSVRKRYRAFEIRRRNGAGTRVIHAPIPPIKEIQRKLATVLTPLYAPRVYVHGYVPRRSILSNAKVHTRQRWLLRIDLANFFPSIHFGRVQGLFLAKPFSYPKPVATLLAQICCHRNELPQGAPTSPLISNLICRGLDRQIADLARAHHCYYTRYCDDLTFSTSRRLFPASLAIRGAETDAVEAGSVIRAIIEQHSFSINPQKTVLRYRDQRQLVTGLVVNEFPNTRRKYVRSIRNLLFAWKHHGKGTAEALWRSKTFNRPPDKEEPDFRSVIRGRVQFVGSIKGWHSSVYRRLARSLAERDESFRPTTKSSKSVATTFNVYCEGKTDYVHLRAALEHFQNDGRFIELDLRFQTHVGQGDQDLLKKCESFALVEQAVPCIFVFDRDNAAVVRRVSDGDSFVDWGRGVFSFPIPIPDHRQGDKACIELLYPDSILRTVDSSGRRVYLVSEFNRENGSHSTEEGYYFRPSGKNLILDRVIDMRTKKNVALSKTSFAELVRRRQSPLEHVDFEGFRPLFEMFLRVRQALLTCPS